MITGHLINKLAAEMVVRDKFSVVSGVLEDSGGQDEGPDPHELLESALAGCTIITVQMYALRKGWPLESTNVKIKIESETKEATTISREVSFVGSLSDEQKERLLEISNKCPIHNLLESKVTIQTKQV